MNDLTVFLSARLDEDEAAAKAVRVRHWIMAAIPDGDSDPSVRAHTARHDPARVLREVEAKRAVVRRCAARMNEMDVHPNGLVSPRALLARQVLMDLTAAWSDHPDCDPEWTF